MDEICLSDLVVYLVALFKLYIKNSAVLYLVLFSDEILEHNEMHVGQNNHYSIVPLQRVWIDPDENEQSVLCDVTLIL